jgi:hypothetical protein
MHSGNALPEPDADRVVAGYLRGAAAGAGVVTGWNLTAVIYQ